MYVQKYESTVYCGVDIQMAKHFIRRALYMVSILNFESVLLWWSNLHFVNKLLAILVISHSTICYCSTIISVMFHLCVVSHSSLTFELLIFYTQVPHDLHMSHLNFTCESLEFTCKSLMFYVRFTHILYESICYLVADLYHSSTQFYTI